MLIEPEAPDVFEKTEYIGGARAIDQKEVHAFELWSCRSYFSKLSYLIN
jgi:hypothetical protein